jgi:hypothetical protein
VARLAGAPMTLMHYPAGSVEYGIAQEREAIYLLEDMRVEDVLRGRTRPHTSEMLASAGGWTPHEEQDTRVLTWSGLSGFKRIRMKQRIGITGFEFQHRPSRASADVTLLEFRPPG